MSTREWLGCLTIRKLKFIFHMKKMVGGVSYNNEIEFRLNPGKKGEAGGGSSSIGFDLFRNPCEQSSSSEKRSK